jgi:hypothetical protein
MSTRVNIKGKKFGNLNVLEFVGNRNTHAFWRVRCLCGVEFEASYSNLISGNTTNCSSCGQKTHGLCGTDYYRKYISLIQRQKRDNIDSNWHTFQGFKEDTFSTYKDGFRLKRLDNKKPFSKKNCCWIVPRVGNNKSKIVYFKENNKKC